MKIERTCKSNRAQHYLKIRKMQEMVCIWMLTLSIIPNRPTAGSHRRFLRLIEIRTKRYSQLPGLPGSCFFDICNEASVDRIKEPWYSGINKCEDGADMQNIWYVVLICFLAGAGAGLGTGFAGMSAAAVISPMLITFLKMEPYDAVGIALASDVLASAVSAYTYGKNKNLDI